MYLASPHLRNSVADACLIASDEITTRLHGLTFRLDLGDDLLLDSEGWEGDFILL